MGSKNNKSKYYFLIFMIVNVATFIMADKWKDNYTILNINLDKEIQELSTKELDYKILSSEGKKVEELFKSDFIYVDGALTIDLKDFTEISYSEYLNKHKDENVFRPSLINRGFIDSNYDMYRETYWKKGDTYANVGIRTNNLKAYEKDLQPKEMLKSIITFNKKFKENSDENVFFDLNNKFESALWNQKFESILWNKTDEYISYKNTAKINIEHYNSINENKSNDSLRYLQVMFIIFFENIFIFFYFIYPRIKKDSMKDIYKLKPIKFKFKKMKNVSKLSKETIDKMSKVNKENKKNNAISKEYKQYIKIKNE